MKWLIHFDCPEARKSRCHAVSEPQVLPFVGECIAALDRNSAPRGEWTVSAHLKEAAMASKLLKIQLFFRRTVLPALLLAAIVSMCPSTVLGQGATAALNGTVLDPSGLPVAGAKVSLLNLNTQTSEISTTNDAGFFAFAALSPAPYSLTIEKQGFETDTIPSFTLAVNQTLTENVQLTVGAVTQQVVVKTSEESLETTTTELGTAIQTNEVSGLPLNGRNFTQLLTLTPGTSPIMTDQSSGVGSNGSSAGVGGGSFGGHVIGTYSFPAVDGQPNRSNMFLLDGLSDYAFLGTYAVAPIIDDIQEFKVQSHNDSSAFGGALGGIVNVVTRGGTREYHGDAWEFLRNSAFDARNYFNTVVTPLKWNQFGATFGGPAFPERFRKRQGPAKSFFFFAYEHFHASVSAEIKDVIPTQAQLGGDLSSISAQIYDPFTTAPDPAHPGYYTRTPYKNNQIPSGEINQSLVAYAEKFFPVVTQLPTNGFNFTDTTPNITINDTGTARFDHKFNDQLQMWATLTKFYSPSTVAIGIPGVVSAVDDYGYLTGGSVTWISRSGNSILSLRGGKTSANVLLNYQFPSSLTNAYQVGGFNSQYVTGFAGGRSLNPGQYITGYTNTPEGFDQGNQLADIGELAADYTHVKGKHTLQAGVDINSNNNSQPILFVNQTYDAFQTESLEPASVTPNPGGSSLASFLLGLPFNAERRNLNVTTHGGWVNGFYIEDEWRAAPKLQVNLGFRYDFTLWPIYGSKALGNDYVGDTDLDTGQYILQAVPPACDTGASPCIPTADGSLPANVIVTPKGNGSIIHSTDDNWQPRIGLSYQLVPGTVIRAGAGRFFDNWAAVNQLSTNYMGSWPDTSFLQVTNLNSPYPNAATGQNPLDLGTGGNITPAPTPFTQVNFFTDPFYKNAYAIEWNFGLQQQLKSHTLLEADYVGSHTSRLDSNLVRNVGLYPASTPLSTRQPFSYITPTQFDKSNSNANYNSLQIKARSQYGQNLAALVSYTWSKTIDLGCDGYFGGPAACSVQDPYHMQNDRSVAGFDIPQILSASFIYELPIGSGRSMSISNAVLNAVAGNWGVNGIFTARSGQPFHGVASAQIANTGNNFERPDRTCSSPYSATRGIEYLNTSCFSVPPLYTFGTEPRNDLRSPHVTNLDMSVVKTFPWGENASAENVEFRTDFFNSLNEAALGTPDTTITDPTFGKISSTAQAERIIQLSLKVNF